VYNTYSEVILGRAMSNNPLEKLLSTQEAADILGVHVQTIRQFIRRGELPAVEISARLYKIRPEDLEKFIEDRKTTK
jgi:excisionase family DNA binding protein